MITYHHTQPANIILKCEILKASPEIRNNTRMLLSSLLLLKQKIKQNKIVWKVPDNAINQAEEICKNWGGKK
jgi:hypothetical protein